jgi:hypothetical protein
LTITLQQANSHFPPFPNAHKGTMTTIRSDDTVEVKHGTYEQKRNLAFVDRLSGTCSVRIQFPEDQVMRTIRIASVAKVTNKKALEKIKRRQAQVQKDIDALHVELAGLGIHQDVVEQAIERERSRSEEHQQQTRSPSPRGRYYTRRSVSPSP